ncbi:Hypothetical predicted protein [Octopus vulgaris]|uniref:Uncharacterized protein n=1 Tax=Octopus vulgaris TaxID=6645 RepID=A0AA36AS16_OCTVU|nr:Hypothetical predicted protein [Octopus vulgaris]
MRWCDHILRLADEHMSKQLSYGELVEGKRCRRKPKKRFKDGIRTSMKSLGMDPEDIETLASDRVGWRTKVWSGVKAFEEARITHVRLKKRSKEELMIEKMNDNDLFVYSVCDKPCLSFAGLKSHLQNHGKRTSANYSAYVCAHFSMQCLPGDSFL